MKIDKEKIVNILEDILIFLVCLLGIKKGGYYKADSILVIALVMLCSMLYFILNYNNIKRNNALSFFLLILAISYFIPVLIQNTATVSGAIMLGIKLFSAFVVYLIVSNTKKKEKYKISIVFFAVIIGIFAIDEASKNVLEKILQLFGGGYNTGKTGRVAGVMQYSNLLGIVSTIATLFALEKAITVKNVKRYIYILAIPFLTSVMVLSESKAVFLIYCVSVIIYLIHEKKYEYISKMVLNTAFSMLCMSILNPVLAVSVIEALTIIYVFLTEKFISNKIDENSYIKNEENPKKRFYLNKLDKINYAIIASGIVLFVIYVVVFSKMSFLENGMIASFKNYFINFHSTKLRLVYYWDVVRIMCMSVKNFIFGMGGNAFRTMYEVVQTRPYISLETHSLWMQLLLEGGIAAFVSMLSVVVYIAQKSKLNIEKIAFLAIIVYATFDLFLTYTFAMYLLFIILALCEVNKEDILTKENTLIKTKKNIIFVCGFCGMYIAVNVILGLHTAAFCIKPMDNGNINNTLQAQEKIVSSLEKVLALDPYDLSYRRDYISSLNTYIDILEIKNELYGEDNVDLRYEAAQKIYDCAKLENKYERNNKYAIEDSAYYTYKFLDELVFRNYAEETLTQGYENYLSEMLEMVQKLHTDHYRNEYARDVYLSSLDLIVKKYTYVNMMLNSDTITNTLKPYK